VNARRNGSMWVSAKRLRGLGKVLGGLAGSGEALASELHGGSAMANGGKEEKSCACSGGSFYRWNDLEEGPRLPLGDKLARAAMGQHRPRRPRLQCMAAWRVAARRLARVVTRGPNSRGGAAQVDDGGGDATVRRRY
jgi:hypothetical protein